jgi:hypothetical protein
MANTIKDIITDAVDERLDGVIESADREELVNSICFELNKYFDNQLEL